MNQKVIPEGFELVWNPVTCKEVMRPIFGFSDKYLTPTSFVPENSEKKASSKSGKNNSNLSAAKINKNDEYFTGLGDIVKELKHYTNQFKDKVVYCPCDKAFNLGRSKFIEYFLAIFHIIGLKKLICTQYNPNGKGEMKVVDFANRGFKWEYHGEYKDGSKIDESMIDITLLEGDGSFESEECQKLMRECDIVVTNPPFSRFKEFLAQLMKYDKKFLIIGNMNAITYKDVFSLIKGNKLWLGMTNPSTFETPEGEKKTFGNTRWFTNLNHDKRIEEIYLPKTYNPDDYQKYDNYDAIEVDKTKNIPNDYDGVIGVPISFLERYNPNQFAVIGMFNDYKPNKVDLDAGLIGGEPTYVDEQHKRFCGPVIQGKSKYARILIRNLHPVKTQ